MKFIFWTLNGIVNTLPVKNQIFLSRNLFLCLSRLKYIRITYSTMPSNNVPALM